MAHKHSVYDTDNHFLIDGVTRAVRNASQTKTMVVQHDHNSERFTFEIPRMVDGHDMSGCNVVQVHYINIDSKDKNKFNEGVYSVDDLQISPDDEDVVICSWLISGNATKYVGKLEFVVRFSCVSDDGTIDYAWNTAKHSNVYVTEGIYNGDAIAEEYVDILAQHEARIKALEQGGDTGGGDTGGSDDTGGDPALFLYGTPSESGNIGLRSGDTVTYYNGAVLPEMLSLPDGYTNAHIMHRDYTDYDLYIAFATKEELLILSDGTVGLSEGVGANGISWYYRESRADNYNGADLVWDGWSSEESLVSSYPPMWANYDMLSLVDGSVYLPATDPIPVGEIVDYINNIPIYEVI